MGVCSPALGICNHLVLNEGFLCYLLCVDQQRGVCVPGCARERACHNPSLIGQVDHLLVVGLVYGWTRIFEEVVLAGKSCCCQRTQLLHFEGCPYSRRLVWLFSN